MIELAAAWAAWVDRRGQRRDTADEARVVAALAKHPHLDGQPLMNCTGLSGGRVVAALERMQTAGTVTYTIHHIEDGVPRRMWELKPRQETSRG